MSSKGHRRGGHHGGGHGSSERWLVTYADFITLLTVLFIVLWSFSQTDIERFRQLAQSLNRALGQGLGPGIAAPSGDPTRAFGGGPNVLTPFLSERQGQEFGVIVDQLNRFVQAEGLGDAIEVTTNQEGTVISISGSLLFPSGRAELRPEAARTLSQIADLLRPLPNAIRIDGHTDDIAPNSALFPSNWELSVARSIAVLRFLTNQEQLPASRFAVAGFAEFRPLVPNTDIQSRMKNRRTDIVILYRQPERPVTQRP